METKEHWQPSQPIAVGETVVVDGVPRVCAGAGPAAEAPLSVEEIAAIKARNAARTPGRWKWWTSNSFRRLSARGDGDVAYPFVNSCDGHPDIAIHEEDMAFIEGTTEDVPRLLATIDARDAEINGLVAHIREFAKKLNEAIAERDMLRASSADALSVISEVLIAGERAAMGSEISAVDQLELETTLRKAKGQMIVALHRAG